MKTIHESRRTFLKTSAAGAAGLMVGGLPVSKAAASSAGAWTDGMQVNPNINNLRVVCAHDVTSLGGTDGNTFSAGAVEAVMDKMAIALAQKPTAAQAWAAIFQKPAGKAWADVKVGIKAPGTQEMFNKICLELHNLGVQYPNIYYFDSNTTVCFVNFPPTNGAQPSMGANTTTGQYVNLLHGLTPAPVPYKGVMVNMNCTTDIVNGTIDLLITFMYNHSHSDWNANASLCCKSLYGVFNGVDSLQYLHGTLGGNPDGITGLLSLQKSQAILGGTPPRQQLVMCNAMGNDNGFVGNRLIMGTFAPIVDWLVITKIRQKLQNDKPNANVVARYYQDFGYTAADVANLDFVDALSYSTAVAPRSQPTLSSRLQLIVSTSAFKMATADFDLPYNNHLRISVKIYDQRGRLVRELTPSWEEGSTMVAWDGKSQSGLRVPAGVYAVHVKNGVTSGVGSISLVPR